MREGGRGIMRTEAPAKGWNDGGGGGQLGVWGRQEWKKTKTTG